MQVLSVFDDQSELSSRGERVCSDHGADDKCRFGRSRKMLWLAVDRILGNVCARGNGTLNLTIFRKKGVSIKKYL